MPSRPLRLCNHIGCTELVTNGYCEKHQPISDYDKNRGTAAQRGYDSRWRKYRIEYLKKNPLCVECLKEGRYTPATVVDHIVDHKGDKKLFWDTNNHQPLCKHHHDSKTARTNPKI